MKVFTAKEICELLKIYPKTFGYWVKRGALNPEIYAPKGRGTTRLFSGMNLFEAAIIQDLMGTGLSIDYIKSMLDFFRERQLLQSMIDLDWNSSETLYLISAMSDAESKFEVIVVRVGGPLPLPENAPVKANLIDLTTWLGGLALNLR